MNIDDIAIEYSYLYYKSWREKYFLFKDMLFLRVCWIKDFNVSTDILKSKATDLNVTTQSRWRTGHYPVTLFYTTEEYKQQKDPVGNWTPSKEWANNLRDLGWRTAFCVVNMIVGWCAVCNGETHESSLNINDWK